MKNTDIARSELVEEALEFFYKHHGPRLTWDEREFKHNIELYMTKEQLIDLIKEYKGEDV